MPADSIFISRNSPRILRFICVKALLRTPIIFALLFGFNFSQAAQEPVSAQLQKIESLQRRADILAAGELGQDNYHLAKARIWLDIALSEYHESEKNGIVSAAIEQASTLLDALEKKQADISMDTPVHVPGSEPVRPDLWKKIASLKSNEKHNCGQRQIAEAEVYLVWAGHEKFEANWTNAKTYAHNATALIGEARAEIDKCSALPLPKNPLTEPKKPTHAVLTPTHAVVAAAPAVEKPSLPVENQPVAITPALAPVVIAPEAPTPVVIAAAPVVEKPSLLAANQAVVITPAPAPAPALASAPEVLTPEAPTPAIMAPAPAMLAPVPAMESPVPAPAVAAPAPAMEKPSLLAANQPVSVTPAPATAPPVITLEAPTPVVIASAPAVEKPSLPAANQPVVITPAPVMLEPAPAVESPPPAVVARAPVPKNPPTTSESFTLASGALFEFGKATLDPSALWQLNRLAKNIMDVTKLEEVVLIGHTDRLRSDGRYELNQLLSEQRAESVRRYLIQKKIPAEKIHASGAGSSQPLVECPTDQNKEKQIACLKPNRRVEIILRGTRSVTTRLAPEN